MIKVDYVIFQKYFCVLLIAMFLMVRLVCWPSVINSFGSSLYNNAEIAHVAFDLKLKNLLII
jgi:hypothetical protein